ncbi:Hsp70 family protein [Isosphaeraceae bacterium EP7]
MARPRYVIGIDLGTTNCAVAYVDTKGKERPTADIRPFDVPQLVAAGETAPRSMLPSFLYLPGTHDLPQGAAVLPWRDDADRIVGEFARIQGARVPSHLVSSAKSWLCHPGVDREADILPWGAPAEARKVSPVEASADLLRHIRDAWDATFAKGDDTRKFVSQEIVLTVPASFDEAARELTLEAAKRAGILKPVLLEEPQAAFYCWIVSHQDGWQREVKAGERILVCDIGGGTSDFSLITVVETPDGPAFRRVAVGDHLLLGGDNIDLALAHAVEAKLKGARLDTEQWSALRLACRTAKEKLLADGGPERWPVTIAGRGSKLIGGAIQSDLTRDEVRKVALDGFFPATNAADEPGRGARAGLQEFGLPFVNDPAIPRHLSAFLRRHAADGAPEGQPHTGRPDAILFNGGALTPPVVRERIVQVITAWFAGSEPESATPYKPRVLTNASLDLAVANGAAYYGIVRRGGGIRIGGGTARSFYVGFQGQPGSPPWLCTVPRDAQEGDEFAIEGRDFELLMGRPVAFPLASSSVRPQDKPGDLVPADPNSILDLPPLVGLMKVGRKAKAEQIPVSLAARVTEVGTIELWCQSRTDDRRWRLQVQLRGPSNRAEPGADVPIEESERVVLEQSYVDAGVEAIRVAFADPSPPEDRGPSRLVKILEEVVDLPRDQWPPSALRSFWEPLRDAADRRAKSSRHESRWLNLAGYCLRPGVGYPLDELRIKAAWSLWHQSVKHPKDPQCWAEFWILWRRVAAGLTKAHHEEIHRRIAPFLIPPKAAGGLAGVAKKANRPKPEPHEVAEIWRTAAALERIPAAAKTQLGDALAADLTRPGPLAHIPWCLGRLGARVPLFGPANTVVPPDVAARWLAPLLARENPAGRETGDLTFALTQLARLSGDRARDLDPDLRHQVAARLAELGASEESIRPILELQTRKAADQAQALGDTLPTGLRLIVADVAAMA